GHCRAPGSAIPLSLVATTSRRFTSIVLPAPPPAGAAPFAGAGSDSGGHRSTARVPPRPARSPLIRKTDGRASGPAVRSSHRVLFRSGGDRVRPRELLHLRRPR